MNNYKQQIIDLWRVSFPEDTEEFIRLYFERKYKEENTLAFMYNQKEIVSALQMIPYDMTFYGNKIATSYISGACTHPDHQRFGMMSSLMLNAFLNMHRNNVPLSTLIPASEKLVDFYKKLNYTPVFDYSQEHYETIDLLGKNITTSKYETGEWNPADEEDTYAYFAEKERERPLSIQHTQADFSIIIEDIHNEQGTLFYIRNTFNHRICGLAFAVPSEDSVLVKELLFDGEGGKHLLLWTIAKKYSSSKEIICTVPPPCKSTVYQLGMARVIDAESLLAFYAKSFPEKEFALKITDPLLTFNTGVFIVKGGEVCRNEGKTLPENAIALSIEQFTHAILGYHTENLPGEINVLFSFSTPYINLMLN